MADVRIHYRRPPDREDIFVQRLVHRDENVVVTYLDRTPMSRPMEVDGRVVLEDGSPVVWFTFPGLWHDIGRFHRADGTFTGLYANILTPVRFLDEDTWETTDLYLDVWVDPTGRAVILDEDELLDAEARGWVEPALVEAARAEANRLLDATRLGEWPPPMVEAWTLERVRDENRGG